MMASLTQPFVWADKSILQMMSSRRCCGPPCKEKLVWFSPLPPNPARPAMSTTLLPKRARGDSFLHPERESVV